MDRKGEGFGTIIATIGSILIAAGIAWIVATNWHSIPSFAKIFILAFFTLGCFIAGVLLKEREYPGIAHALFVLGSLLFTLSAFLIAQIFNISLSLQSTAWIFFICWIGVAFAAYLFTSYVSLFIALIEFILWLGIQFIAFSNQRIFSSTANSGGIPIFVAFAFLILLAGILFYGLSLIHRTNNNEFARLYLWWTAFYFLVFSFILTFQSIIPFIWSSSETLSLSGGSMIFLYIFSLISLIVLVVGMLSAYYKSTVSKKEVLAVVAIIVVLVILIFLMKIPANATGACYTKSCYDFNTQSLCPTAPASFNCVWQNVSWANNEQWECVEKNCYNYKSQSLCEANSAELGCKWYFSNLVYPDGSTIPVAVGSEGNCQQMSCYDFKEVSSCQNSPQKLNCYWQQSSSAPSCQPNYTYDYNKNCGPYNNKYDECISHNECKWQPGYGYFGSKTQNLPFSIIFIWVIANIFFILFILAIIGFGTLEKFPALINLGICAFGIEILARYIGFAMDLWGYNIMSIVFIIGGILLLVCGWFIEKWRRNLIREVSGEKEDKTTEKEDSDYKKYLALKKKFERK